MLYIIHGPDGGPLIVDGSFIAADGTLTVLDRGDFTLTPTASWTSPHSAATYPAGWNVVLTRAATRPDPESIDAGSGAGYDCLNERHLLGG